MGPNPPLPTKEAISAGNIPGKPSYATISGKPNGKKVNVRTLFTPGGNEIDVIVLVDSIHAISERFANIAYGFFLKRRWHTLLLLTMGLTCSVLDRVEFCGEVAAMFGDIREIRAYNLELLFQLGNHQCLVRPKTLIERSTHPTTWSLPRPISPVYPPSTCLNAPKDASSP
nr:hypothetical protein [Tanacetum cinerariifolium]